jgi:hypothetical protein
MFLVYVYFQQDIAPAHDYKVYWKVPQIGKKKMLAQLSQFRLAFPSKFSLGTYTAIP